MLDSTTCVIIPHSGRKAFLRAALASCLQQTLVPSQVLVVNDSANSGNFEELQETIKAFKTLLPGLQAIQSTRSSGAGPTRNTGLEHCKSRFVAFLDDDDAFLPWKLEKQSELMLSTGAAMSHTSYLRHGSVSGELTSVDTGRHQGGYDALQKLVHRECWIATPTVMIDARALGNEVLLFPENRLLGEDTIAWIKFLASTNGSLAHLEIPSTLVRTHPNSIQGSLKTREGLLHRQNLRRTVDDYANQLGIKPVRFDLIRKLLLKATILIFNLAGKPAFAENIHSRLTRWL